MNKKAVHQLGAMLTSEQFHDWCIKLNLSEQAEQQIQQIRSSPPSRRVQSRVGNVSGRYPSQKMGVTIQFESHQPNRDVIGET